MKVLRGVLLVLGVLGLLVLAFALFLSWNLRQGQATSEQFHRQTAQMLQVCAAKLRAQPGVTGHLADDRAGYGSTRLDVGGRITWEVLGEWQTGEQTRLFECEGMRRGAALTVTRVAFVEK